jgi:transcriptional regulator of acetoin/glycerol metabolism
MFPAPSTPVPTSQLQVSSIVEQIARALADNSYPEAKKKLIREFDHAYSALLLQKSNGNVSEAARLAGLDRSNFRRILRRYESSDDTDTTDNGS